MNILLLLRKADEMGVNLGLRILALGLSVVLGLLVTYYFLVVNRNLHPSLPAKIDASKVLEAEKRRADAAIVNKVKSAISQTKRLHGYSLGVECRLGKVVLTGEVPTDIDKDLATNLAQEILGVTEVTNQLNVLPAATPQSGEIVHQDLALNVDDLELQANLRERVISIPDLKLQRITIKVQNRSVTLTGEVASESQRLRTEQLLRNYPKVTSVNNQLRIGATTGPRKVQPALPRADEDQALAQRLSSSLNINHDQFAKMEAIKVTVQNGAITLSGSVPSQAERTRAEEVTRQLAGMKSVRNLIVIRSR